MKAIDRIRDRTKSHVTKILLAVAAIRQISHFYQKRVTNSYANISFRQFSNFIIVTMSFTPQHSIEDQICLFKKSKFFYCQEKVHSPYDYSKKGKNAAISKSVNNDHNSQEKSSIF